MNTYFRMTHFVMTPILFVVASGCSESTAPKKLPAPVAPAAPAANVEEQVLRALDYYEPVYKTDAAGHVTRLRLGGRHVPASVMAEVGKLKHLEGIELFGTTVDDEGLAQLKDLQKLRTIGLVQTNVTDKGLATLEKLGGLQYGWVSKKSISAEAIEKLKDARPDLRLFPQ